VRALQALRAELFVWKPTIALAASRCSVRKVGKRMDQCEMLSGHQDEQHQQP
jgi:hypothetical protein